MRRQLLHHITLAWIHLAWVTSTLCGRPWDCQAVLVSIHSHHMEQRRASMLAY
jgi:hypothetical protein